MRILHLISGLGNGGAEGVLYRVATCDAENEHIVMTLSGEAYYGPRLRLRGVPVISIPVARGAWALLGLFRALVNIRRIKPDVIQTWMYHADLLGGFMALFCGRPPVIWGIRCTDVQGKTSFIRQLCARLSHYLPSRILINSHCGASAHQSIGFDRAKIVVVPNGFDTSLLRPCSKARQRIRDEFGFSASDFLIGMVARWHPHKDHASLLEGLAAFSRTARIAWRCILVGPGISAENAELVALIRCHGLSEKVVLAGPRENIAEIMNALDLHVLPSMFGEGFPNVVGEAMACAVPCVVTDLGDSPFVVGESGWIVPVRAPRELSHALMEAGRVYENRSEWNQRRMESRARIEREFSLGRMLDAFRAVWGDARQSKGGRRCS